MKLKIVLGAALLAARCVPASAQTPGDWVLARYKVGNGKITVAYDDGDRETLPVSAVRPYDWMIGMPVECNFKGQGQWYSGTIASLAGERIGINYDDGDRETTKTGRCRSR